VGAKGKAAGRVSPAAAFELFFYFYFIKPGGINVQLFFRKLALCFLRVA
jgi:hypothetical protein